MLLKNVKKGDTIKHYCFGDIVQATVIDILPNGVKTRHEPVKWGRDIFTEGYVLISTPLQMPISQTTPKAWTENNEPIIVNEP